MFLFDDLCKHYLIFLILSRPYPFGSSTLPVWFRKHAARAANNSHVCHEGVKYSCKYCRYKATQQSKLKRHQESIHEGVKFSCDQCKYHATQKSNLIAHKRSVHDGLKYSCDQCEYQTGQKFDLKLHKKKNH